MKIKIGTPTFTNYSANRNILHLPFEKYTFEKAFSWYKIPSFLYYKLFKRSLLKTEFRFNDTLLQQNIPLLHFFNMVSDGRKPWMTSFESYVPYWEPGSSYGKDLQMLAGEPCKQILPISGYAKNVCRANVEKYNPGLWKRIEEKMLVLHPPQKQVFERFEDKVTDDRTLSVAMVGSFFFNKAGLAVVRAVRRMISEGHPVKLYIISSMTYHVWNVTGATDEDYKEVMKTIADNPDQITYHKSLPNEQVLELLKKMHIGLLPSLGDTYGYSVLEFMSAGCPVITTDAFAFPEINNGERGWVIPVPKDSLNNPLLNNAAEIKKALKTVEDGLYDILVSSLHQQDRLREMGRKGWNYVTQNHSQVKNAQLIENLYDRILTI